MLERLLENILVPIIWFLIALGVVVFVWGVFEMLMNSENIEARAKGRRHMLAGVFGMFIMTSAWGIIYLISQTLQEIGR